MSAADRQRLERFGVLVRLHELQLEQARVERAAIEAAVERQQARVREVQTKLESCRSEAQVLVSQGTGVCAGTLQQLQSYLRWQAGVLAEQQRALERGRELAQQASAAVARRFERLSVIERARDRRERDIGIRVGRRAQKALDDQAHLKRRG